MRYFIFCLIFSLSQLLAFTLQPCFATEIDGLTPTVNDQNVELTAPIIVRFTTAINPTTVTSSSFVVYGLQSGTHQADVTYDSKSRMIRVQPESGYFPGERISAIVSRKIIPADGSPFLADFSWQFQLKSAPANANFVEQSRISVGRWPQALVLCDVDDDGDLDIAAVNQGSDSATLLMNEGSFRFKRIDYRATGEPSNIFPADIDRDGDIDLLIPKAASNEISTFLNDGTGIFTQQLNDSCGKQPLSIDAIDLDNDGYQEVVVANFEDDTISLFLNRGDGNLLESMTFSTGNSAASVISADWNSDGKMDIAAGNRYANTITVFMNAGNGTLQKKVDYSRQPADRTKVSKNVVRRRNNDK